MLVYLTVERVDASEEGHQIFVQSNFEYLFYSAVMKLRVDFTGQALWF